MHVRDATREDLPAIREVVFMVHREFGYAPEPEGADLDLFGQVDAYFAEGGLLRVLVSGDDDVVGMLGVVPVDRETAELRKLYLLPSARGSGYGRALMEEAIDFARRRGAARLVLQSAARLERALAMYERAGFREVDAETRSSTCDRSMELAL